MIIRFELHDKESKDREVKSSDNPKEVRNYNSEPFLGFKPDFFDTALGLYPQLS